MLLADFYETIAEDPRITVSHISLYFALVNAWEQHNQLNTFDLDRAALMKNSKISSRATYDKAMHDLDSFGYIIYEPVHGCGKSRASFKRL